MFHPWVKRWQATLWKASCQPGEAGRAYAYDVQVRRYGATGPLHVLRHAARRESVRSVVALSCAGMWELLLLERAGCSDSSLAPGLKVR
jgi:hypothetical protein